MLDGMICEECGKECKRVCRACQAARVRRGMLMHQRRFLQTWRAGEIAVRLRAFDGVEHLELFDDRWHGYCGVEMFKLTQPRRVRDLPADVCPECLKIFNGLAAQADLEAKPWVQACASFC
jgi:hypothetical protein